MSKKRRGANPAEVERGLRLETISPLTENQRLAFEAYEDSNLLLTGAAGTGKTFIALYLGLRSVLEDMSHSRVVIVRSAVPTRDMGFMKGGPKEKGEVFEGPYESMCARLFNRPDAYSILSQRRQVEFMTTSYIRGLTIDDAVFIVDECQSMNFHELDSLITRVGENTKVVFCGDVAQNDLTKPYDKSGLEDFSKILSMMPSFSVVRFTRSDIVRSGLVREYIEVRDYNQK